jgi:putative transposase
LATFFNYPAQIGRLIYTTNAIEGYHRQLRTVTKNKASFPALEAVHDADPHAPRVGLVPTR